MSRLLAQGYTSILFAVIDIVKESTTILISGHAGAAADTFAAPLEDDNTIHLPGILSRKKHIVPLLGNLAQRIGSQ
jgi:inorganic pyrophosphatase/exopolyphosphatase